MDDFKNIAKVIGLLLAGMVWFYYQFHLNVTDEDIRSYVLKSECPKVYDFRIVSCRIYRGYIFQGIERNCDTVSLTIDYVWDLTNKYQKGDRIVKHKGSRIMYLIKPNGDSLTIHMLGRDGGYY